MPAHRNVIWHERLHDDFLKRVPSALVTGRSSGRGATTREYQPLAAVAQSLAALPTLPCFVPRAVRTTYLDVDDVVCHQLGSHVALVHGCVSKGQDAIQLCKVVAEFGEQVRVVKHLALALPDDMVLDVNNDAGYVSKKLWACGEAAHRDPLGARRLQSSPPPPYKKVASSSWRQGGNPDSPRPVPSCGTFSNTLRPAPRTGRSWRQAGGPKGLTFPDVPEIRLCARAHTRPCTE